MSAVGSSAKRDRTIAVRPAAIVLILLFLSTSCTRRSAAAGPAGDLQIRLEADSQAVGRTALTIRITDDSGAPVRGAQVTVRGDMSHAGMVPVLAEARETDPGIYHTEFEWTMAGNWIITVAVDRPGQDPVEQQFDLPVGGSAG